MIDLINKLTPKTDKLAHFYWGFIYAIISYIAGVYLFNNQYLIMVLPSVLGALKEYRDSKGYGTAEWMDFVYTVIPSVIILLIIKFV